MYTFASHGPDSVCIGDLLVSINDHVPANPSEIDGIVAKNAGDSLFITIDRPTETARVSFKVKKPDFSSGMIRVIPPTANVCDVTEGGASDRAGMKIGDLIIRINGKGFKNVL